MVFSLRTHIFLLLLLLLLTLLPSLPLDAASLVYDPAGGKLTGFWVGRDDFGIGNKPSDYQGKTKNVWEYNEQYIGRLLYVGEPATFSFSNAGESPIGGANMFYLTYPANRKHYREFFLIIRTRGRLHNNGHIYLDASITAISDLTNPNNYNFSITEGAGYELVDNNEHGCNESGDYGVYITNNDGSDNGYKYRYKFSHIWLDTAMIYTRLLNSNYAGQGGYYCSSIGISTNTGANLVLNLQGYYMLTGQTKPMNYCLTIDKYHTAPLSYNIIKRINTKDTALDIATIYYLSFDDAAKISFASDQTGATNFTFKDKDGETFPFFLAFQSTLHPPLTIFPIEMAIHSHQKPLPSKVHSANGRTCTGWRGKSNSIPLRTQPRHWQGYIAQPSTFSSCRTIRYDRNLDPRCYTLNSPFCHIRQSRVQRRDNLLVARRHREALQFIEGHPPQLGVDGEAGLERC